MRSLVRMTLVALTLGQLDADGLAGQETWSTPFHGGQWAAEFSIGNGFNSVGFARFRSPTSAWIVDFGGSYQFTRDSAQGVLIRVRSTAVNTRLGLRSYHPMGSQIHRTITAGLTAAYNRISQEQLGTTLAQRSLGLGVFGNLGGIWMVTTHLSLGASWGGTLTYTHLKATTTPGNFNDRTARTWRLALANVGLQGAFYF